MINWKVRIKNKYFWLCLIPNVLLLIKVVLHMFGIEFEIESINESLSDIVVLVFLILGTLGIVADPTTDGVSDSYLAMTYEEPKKREEI